MSSAPRKQAPRPARPVGRYWKGKAPKGAAADLLSSDEEEDDVGEGREEGVDEEEGDEALVGEQDFLSGAVGAGDEDDEGEEGEEGGGGGKAKKMNIALKDVEIRDGRVVVGGKTGASDDEEDEEEESDESEEDKGEKEDDDDEDGESSSEEESEDEKPKLQFRPVFVPKRARDTVAEREAEAQDTEEAQKKKEREAEERKKQSHDMVAESIRRELAEKEKEEDVPDVDDTDGIDATGEFDAWRLRELARIKRDKEAELAREEERAEIERRRALPEAQRLKEDLERAEKLRAEKPKGQQKFLQKYWHKGAFHQDEEILKRHDFTEATESTVDVSALPKVMQVKNFGKRSRTKYTHLLDQDTTATTGGFGGTAPVKAGGKGTDGGGCFLCGGPHLKKDCPQNTGLPPGRSGTGANAATRGVRNDKPGGWRDRDDKPGAWRDRDDGYPARDRDRDRRRSRSRSVDRRERDRDRDRPPYDRRRDDRDRDRYDGGRARDRSRSRSPPKRGYGRRADDEVRARDRRRSRSRSLSRDGREREGKRRRFD